MKCHILLSEKTGKNTSICRLLKILRRVLSIKIFFQKDVKLKWDGR